MSAQEACGRRRILRWPRQKPRTGNVAPHQAHPNGPPVPEPVVPVLPAPMGAHAPTGTPEPTGTHAPMGAPDRMGTHAPMREPDPVGRPATGTPTDPAARPGQRPGEPRSTVAARPAPGQERHGLPPLPRNLRTTGIPGSSTCPHKRMPVLPAPGLWTPPRW